MARPIHLTLLAITLALAAFTARADVTATLTNKDGSVVLLMNLTCPADRSGRIIATATGGQISRYGCATLADELLLVTWEDGVQSVYPASAFTPHKKRKQF